MDSKEDKLTSWIRTPPAGLQAMVIVATNLVPVAGVLFFDWEVFTILFLYWLENVVVGFFNVLKMWLQPGRALLIPFFMVHYGLFMLVHGLAVVGLFLEPQSTADFVAAMTDRWVTLGVALGLLVFEHGYSYYHSFLASGEYKEPSGIPQMLRPYGRLVVMHLTLIFGAMAVLALGSPPVALLVLILFKTLFDLGASFMQVKTLPDLLDAPIGRWPNWLSLPDRM